MNQQLGTMQMLKSFAAIAGSVLVLATGVAQAQTSAPATPPGTQPAPAGPPAADPAPEAPKHPLGITFTATMTAVSDYSYRGISQTQRIPAFQPGITIETGPFSDQLPISAYVGMWASNVNFPGTNAWGELDASAGFRAKLLNDKLTFDLGYIRYNYMGVVQASQLPFNEFGFVAAYDFDFAQLSGAIRYSPNFFGNSGNAWYKWGQLTVPLPFIKINDQISFKLFGTLGNQYVERFTNYGIPSDNYWDWQAGAMASIYGFDLSVAYVSTNLSYTDCTNTANCAGRAVVSIGKTF
jgi:uncharacterized protein (TIGR02001 family)